MVYHSPGCAHSNCVSRPIAPVYALFGTNRCLLLDGAFDWPRRRPAGPAVPAFCVVVRQRPVGRLIWRDRCVPTVKCRVRNAVHTYTGNARIVVTPQTQLPAIVVTAPTGLDVCYIPLSFHLLFTREICDIDHLNALTQISCHSSRCDRDLSIVLRVLRLMRAVSTACW